MHCFVDWAGQRKHDGSLNHSPEEYRDVIKEVLVTGFDKLDHTKRFRFHHFLKFPFFVVCKGWDAEDEKKHDLVKWFTAGHIAYALYGVKLREDKAEKREGGRAAKHPKDLTRRTREKKHGPWLEWYHKNLIMFGELLKRDGMKDRVEQLAKEMKIYHEGVFEWGKKRSGGENKGSVGRKKRKVEAARKAVFDNFYSGHDMAEIDLDEIPNSAEV